MRVVQARLPDDLADFVDKEFGHGFKQTFIERCFQNLRNILIEGRMHRPAEYADQAVADTVVESAGMLPRTN